MKNVLQILLAYSITLSTESASFTVFNNNDNSTTFECGTNLTLRCHMDKASNVLRWQIDYLVGASTNAAANCFSSPCQVFDNFGRRYSYSLNALAQISDLNISPVDSTDNRRQYRCDDFISPSIFVATVKVPPKNETMHMSINNDTIKVTTGCIFNAGNLTYYWYKRKENETNGQMIQSSQPDISDEYCACMNNCTGYCWKSSYTVDVYGLGKAGETYEIYCVIETTDTDVNGPVIVIANQTFTAKAPVTTRMSTTSTTRRTTSFITESTEPEATSSPNITVSFSTTNNSTNNVSVNTGTTDKQGKQTLIIAVSVGGGILILIVISVVVICCARNSTDRKKNITNTEISLESRHL